MRRQSAALGEASHLLAAYLVPHLRLNDFQALSSTCRALRSALSSADAELHQLAKVRALLLCLCHSLYLLRTTHVLLCAGQPASWPLGLCGTARLGPAAAARDSLHACSHTSWKACEH